MSDKRESPIPTRPLQVLHLEDSPQDAELVRDRLDVEGVSCNILVVHGRASFEAALAEQSFDLILSDYSMVGYDGVTALKHAQATQPDVPVILISGTVIDEDAVKCLHLGATDYLLKGRLERLVPAVHRAIQEAETRRQRKQAEAAVRSERDRAQQYLDTADVILLALDLDARITLINRKGCDVVGWTESELLGRDWIETCLPARIRHAIQEKRHNVLRGDFSIVENPILMKTGEERLIEWHNAVMRDDDGHVIGTFSSGTDVTERHQAVAALAEAEERMRFALQNANVGIWDMDYRTRNLRWSETHEALYGLSPGTFEGTFDAFVDRVHPDDREALLATVNNATQSGEDFTVENRAVWPDGTVRWLRGMGRIHVDEHGEPVRGIGISQDVTEQRRTDAELQRLDNEIQIQRLRVFKATMRTVQDIVNNLLNNLQLVHLEEDYRHTAEIQTLVDRVIREAAVKLETLGNLETIIEKEMIVGPGIDYPGSAA